LDALAFDAVGWQETEQEQRVCPGNANALLEAASPRWPPWRRGESGGLTVLR
ncbi:MAG: hypothetical protein IPM03_13825, partial [Sulfuritalea sp.]|nr:hypothetical protein [Sulfuritalea sp.]